MLLNFLGRKLGLVVYHMFIAEKWQYYLKQLNLYIKVCVNLSEQSKVPLVNTIRYNVGNKSLFSALVSTQIAKWGAFADVCVLNISQLWADWICKISRIFFLREQFESLCLHSPSWQYSNCNLRKTERL